MVVARGRIELPNAKGIEEEEREHYRFRELMIRNKDKRLYRSMMKNRKQREREATRLEEKRKVFDQETKSSKAKKSKAQWNVEPLTKASEVKKKKTEA